MPVDPAGPPDAQPYGDASAPVWQQDPWSWVPEHWPPPIPQEGAPSDVVTPPIPPPVEMGPQMPTAPDALAGTMFDAGSTTQSSPPPPPPAEPPPLGDVLDASMPPIPYGADAEPAAPFGPQLPAPQEPGVSAPGTGDVEGQQQQLNELAQRDPGAFAELLIRHADEQRKVADARRAEIINRDYDTQMKNLANRQAADKATQAKLAAVQADAERIAATKIDPSGGVHGLRRVAGVIAAFLGGLVQDRNGGRNVGLEALNDAINKGIEAQRSDLANQRENLGHRNSALGQELARHGDLYQAEETVRLASLKHADELLATEQQNYDPRGTRALKIAAMRAGIVQQQQTGLAAFNQKKFENLLKLGELADKEATRLAAATKDKADRSVSWANNDLANRRLDYDQRKDALDIALRRDELGDKRDDKTRQDDRELSIGALPRLKVDDKGAPVLDDKGAPTIESGPLTQKDGKLYRAPDAIARKDLATKTLAASEVTDMINEVLDIRDKVGGESSLTNSPEYQRLKVLQNRLVILQKSGTQGMSSDEDMKKLSAAVGADKLDSFREQAAGLEEGRDRTAIELNKAYRIANYNGPKIEFPNPYTKGPDNTAEDNHEQALLEKPKGGFGAAFAAELDRRTAGLSPDQLRAFGPRIDAQAIDRAGFNLRGDGGRPSIGTPLTPAQRAVFEDVAATFNADASPAQQRQLGELADLARGAGPEAAKARSLLSKVSTSAHTAKLRELAKAALDSVVSADALGAGEPVTSPEPAVRSTAHETLPGQGR